MFRMLSRLLGIIVLAGQFAAPAASEESKPPDLIYSPWTKLCSADGSCFIVTAARSECGPVAAAALVEKSGEARKTLHVTLPARVSSERGVRIIIDQGQPIARPYVGCYPVGCRAEYEGGAELVEQLKQGQMLFLEGVDAANSPIRFSVPLANFANAYDGPPSEPRIQEALRSPGLLKESEAHKRAEEARKLRCDAATPLP